MGISRATAITIAFLLWEYYMNRHDPNVLNAICRNKVILPSVIRHIKNHRPRINPNTGFINQLKKYEKTLKLYLLYNFIR